MRGYMIFEIDVTDAAAWADYRRVAGPVMAGAGGRFVFASDRVEPLEGDWAPASVSVVEFPSFDAAHAFYHSPEYQRLAVLRRRASTGRGILVGAATAPETARP